MKKLEKIIATAMLSFSTMFADFNSIDTAYSRSPTSQAAIRAAPRGGYSTGQRAGSYNAGRSTGGYNGRTNGNYYGNRGSGGHQGGSYGNQGHGNNYNNGHGGYGNYNNYGGYGGGYSYGGYGGGGVSGFYNGGNWGIGGTIPIGPILGGLFGGGLFGGGQGYGGAYPGPGCPGPVYPGYPGPVYPAPLPAPVYPPGYYIPPPSYCPPTGCITPPCQGDTCKTTTPYINQGSQGYASSSTVVTPSQVYNGQGTSSYSTGQVLANNLPGGISLQSQSDTYDNSTYLSKNIGNNQNNALIVVPGNPPQIYSVPVQSLRRN